MKTNRFAFFLILAVALAIGSTGCRKRPASLTPLPTRVGPQDPGTSGTVGNPTGIEGGVTSTTGPRTGAEGFTANDPDSHLGWTQNRDQFASETVYFAFDSAAINDAERSKIAAVVDYLKANNSPPTAVLVEGHCDERGTEGYNQTLGERRATAIREELINAGIEMKRVDTISFGEERPAVLGSNDAAWSKNRRGVFVLLTKP